MMQQSIPIRAVLVGAAVPFARPGTLSGIDKTRTVGDVAVGIEGLEGDEQGDRKHHGGPEKALLHYAFEHYAAWRAELPECATILGQPGAFGENISTFGLTEGDVCIGDIWQAGTSVLQVSQGRQPCWKLNHRFGVPDMARRVQDRLRTGWYYRVIQCGRIAAGDTLLLRERGWPGWTIARLLRLLYVDRRDCDDLAAMAELVPLAESWRRVARARLKRDVLEDWTPRLFGSEDTPMVR